MQVSKIKKQLKRPFEFIKRKSEKPREFMTKGRAGAMIAEFLLAAQFFTWIVDEFTLKKLHIILVILISAVLIF